MFMLITHIIIALLSIGVSTILFFTPSRLKIKLSSLLLVSTLISGTILVISTGAPILSTCLTGLVYTSYVVFALYSSSRKLATYSARNR